MYVKNAVITAKAIENKKFCGCNRKTIENDTFAVIVANLVCFLLSKEY